MNLRLTSAAAVMFLASIPTAYANPQEDALKAVTRCAWLLDDQKKLACYNAAAKQADDALAAPPPLPAEAAAAPPPPAESAVGPTAQVPAPAQPAEAAAAPPPSAEGAVGPTAQVPAPAQPAAKQEESWFSLPDIFGSDDKAPETATQQGNEQAPPPPPPPPPGAPRQLASGQPPPPGAPRQLASAQPSPPAAADGVTAIVTDVATHLDGRFIVSLNNGEIWQQVPGDAGSPHFRKGETKVTISQGSQGSYNLQSGDETGIFKVSRVK